jgi:phosphomethylpyrimidine synthase
MKITQDVREYAQLHGIDGSQAALDQALTDKAREFRDGGGEIYTKV